jgi:hypothetical protein
MSAPDYVRDLSRAISAIEESTEIERELDRARTADDVRGVLQRHRQFYLEMSPTMRGELNTKVKELFARLP